eukprot:1139367-Pelagomonas_calceolata.AAC.2
MIVSGLSVCHEHHGQAFVAFLRQVVKDRSLALRLCSRGLLLPSLPSKKITYLHWCALPTKPAHITYSPYILPKYFYLDLPKQIVRSVAQFRLCVHTLKVEQVTWGDTVSPACDLCDVQDDHHDMQDEQHVLFKCTHPHVCSLRLKYASLFSGPLLSLSHSSSSVAPYVPGILHGPEDIAMPSCLVSKV